MDTGSSDLWVADSSCVSCGPKTPVYNAAQSSSNQGGSGVTGQRADIRYGSGQVSGIIASETVSMGGFTMQNQVFRESGRVYLNKLLTNLPL